MDTTQKKNPVYSNSDTSKVAMTDEEWKKILPADVFYIARQKVPKDPGPVSLKVLKKWAPIIVPPVAMPCLKVIPSLKAAAAGPVFMSPSAKSSIIYTPDNTHGWNEQKSVRPL